MDELYDQSLALMESTVHKLAARVPQPQRVSVSDGFVFRHVEKTIHQALVQKMVRIVSGLHATRLLMEHAFTQEQASLQRMLDELQEDVAFLSYGIIFDDVSELHEKYLKEFFEEEFDADTAIESTQKRSMVPRKKIRAYLARAEGAALDESRGIEVSRTLSKMYSGYVHAASPQIMDCYGGNPPRFHMRGMRGTPRHDDHREDLWNYFYRGVMALAMTVKAFGDEKLFREIYAHANQYASSVAESEI